ncbi:hypothetical protein HMPREF0262_00663 [Clostridium sp. ATCC 29733]|nr:hypothetical protein HMPREF0262_00663 [Clostridium sp. ATCC 29733]
MPNPASLETGGRHSFGELRSRPSPTAGWGAPHFTTDKICKSAPAVLRNTGRYGTLFLSNLRDRGRFPAAFSAL